MFCFFKINAARNRVVEKIALENCWAIDCFEQIKVCNKEGLHRKPSLL